MNFGIFTMFSARETSTQHEIFQEWFDLVDVAEAMEAFFRDGPPRAFIRDYSDAFQRLLGQEKAHIKNRQQEELRRAVQGRSNQFYTLWQERGGPDLN